MTTPTMKLRSLRQVADAGVIRHVSLVSQQDGTWEMEIETGTKRVRLEVAREKKARRFRSVDGALAIAQSLGVNKLEVDLTHVK